MADGADPLPAGSGLPVFTNEVITGTGTYSDGFATSPVRYSPIVAGIRLTDADANTMENWSPRCLSLGPRLLTGMRCMCCGSPITIPPVYPSVTFSTMPKVIARSSRRCRGSSTPVVQLPDTFLQWPRLVPAPELGQCVHRGCADAPADAMGALCSI